MRPNAFNFDSSMRDTFRRPIYVTAMELYNWAATKYNQGEEDNPYYGELDKWQEAMKLLAKYFDGSQTYTDPISQTTVNLPTLVDDWRDIDLMMKQDYNVRFISWPLFTHAYLYSDNNDENWAWIMDTFCGKIKRYVNSRGEALYRTLGSLAIKYNPIADYWSKGTELGASAPYLSLTNPESGEEPTISNWNTDSAHTTGYHSEQKAMSGANQPEIDNYTTTYDDSSEGRLANYSTQKGGTETDTSLPNSGYAKKFKEEGNKGQNVQTLLIKEMELAGQMEDLFDNFMRGLEKRVFLSYYTGA